MKKKSKVLIILLMFLTMMYQTTITYATVTVASTEMKVPENVQNTKNYMSIPVYYNGQSVDQVTVYLKKASGLDEGYATFKVKGYAYRNGTTVTLGIVFGYFAKDGTWTEDFLDQAGIVSIDGKYQGTDWKNDSTWTGWQNDEYWIRVDQLPFTDGQEGNKGNTRVRFITATNLGGEFKSRDTSKDVRLTDAPPTEDIVITQDGLTVTKSAKAIENKKNVWEVEVKVEGKNTVATKPTEVVLVLDKSGSMSDLVKMDGHKHTQECYTNEQVFICGGLHKHGEGCSYTKCGKKKHTHTASCCEYREHLVHTDTCTQIQQILTCNITNEGYILKCGENHSHMQAGWNGQKFVYSTCYVSRADKVKQAGYEFIDKIKELNDTKLNVVVYAGGAKQLVGTDLKVAIENEFTNLGSINESYGTNTGLGIQTASSILAAGDKNANKIIVVISDGLSTQPDNGVELVDAIQAATTAKSNKCILYTIGAGIAEGSAGANELQACASKEANNNAKFYLADDTSNALTNILLDIAGEIKEAGSKCIVKDILANEFQVIMDSSLSGNGAKEVGLVDLSNLDWNKVNVAYTQGELLTATNGQVKWDIGDLAVGTPAIIRYRVYMRSGRLGEFYPISTQSEIQYIDSSGVDKTLIIPSISKKALWAGITIQNYTVAEDGTESLVKTSTPIKIWLKAPEDEIQLNNLKIGLSTKINISTLEVDDTGSTTLKDIGKIGIVGLIDPVVQIESDTGVTSINGTKKIQNVDDSVKLKQKEFELNAIVDSSYNYIQPEGVTNVGAELTFKEYTKDINYTANITSIIDEKMSGNPIMFFDITKTTVRVEKLLSIDGSGKKTWEVIDKKYYSLVTPQVTDKSLAVEFNKEGTTNPFVAQKDEVYRVVFYIPTKIKDTVDYTDYKANYINNIVGNKKQVEVEIKGDIRIEEEKWIDGNYYAPIYSRVSKNLNIELKYLPIALIN